MMMPYLAFGLPGPTEMIVIGSVALILFGRRLPEVGRSLGRGIVEFKKGLRGIQDQIDDAGDENVTPSTESKPDAPQK